MVGSSSSRTKRAILAFRFVFLWHTKRSPYAIEESIRFRRNSSSTRTDRFWSFNRRHQLKGDELCLFRRRRDGRVDASARLVKNCGGARCKLAAELEDSCTDHPDLPI